MKSEMRVLTIFVRNGTEKYPAAEQELTDLFQTQLSGVERDTVVVDTALPKCVVEQQPGRILIGGDNSSWEFSGFDSGLSHVGNDLWNYDLVNLVTSAFRQLYGEYLERFRPEVLASILGRPVCLGHIDCYNEAVEVVGCASQHWVRSSCVFIPPTELKILGTMVSTRERELWFSGDPAEPFRSDAPLSAAYRRLITDWLTGQDIGQGVTWHSRIGLDETSLPLFEQKAMAILNEHLFGLRLRAAGCRTIDVTWLSGLLARRARPDWDLPWWRQLADRDRGALRIEPAARRAS
jgi:hypothetical protein